MGIFDFLKPKKIQDDFFGELSFSSGKNALFEGEKIFETKNFDIEFAIESIKIPDLNKSPINWEICYTTIHDKDHWIIINLLSFEPISVIIDG